MLGLKGTVQQMTKASVDTVQNPLRVIRDDPQRLCVLTSPLSPPLTIFRIKKKERKKESQITLHEDVLIQTDS